MKTLIVDRVTVFQQLIASILDDSEIDHVFASTGQEALKKLESDRFVCICIPMYLDDADAFELTRKIRRLPHYRHTPIVLLTSESTQDIIKDALNSGITDIFSKSKVHELVNFIERFAQVNKPISGRVLYIEDQKSQRDLVAAMFKSRELAVDAFDNAEDAWNAFLQHHYHLVVTDLVLTGEVSGVLLINKIRRLDGSKGDTPILAITAFDDNSRRISLYHMGITDYVTKPIIEEELVARVKNLISNQKALEREIYFREHMNSEEMVRRGLKMEALGKLTGGIAHDYNNMLGVIMGYSDLLASKLEGQPKLLHYVSQIEKASKNGAQLTGKLLSFSKKEGDSAEVVDIRNAIADIQPMMEKLLTASVSLRLNLADDLKGIYVNINDLENALLNMCINAKHAMGEKGVLTLVAMNKMLDRDLADKLGLVAGEYVYLSVQDSGSGMDKETLARIFDPFFSTKGESGTGLGLSQVYGFMQRSKGSVTVKSKLGKGTQFNLYFPLNVQEVPGRDQGDAATKDREDGQAQDRQYSVLVVDDEEALAELAAEMLESAGYRTEMAVGASQALEKFKQQEFDVVITDIIMPGMNGYELAEKIKFERPEVKIIITSGYDESAELNAKKASLIECRLNKPVSRLQLIESLNTTLNR